MKPTTNPLITIITATYNSAGVIERCIQSITNQTYKNTEFIIIDGGSKDGTIDLLNKNNNYISKWISEPDTGIYDAWNKGVKLATGEWITFLGSDDTLYPAALADYVAFINSSDSPEIEFVSSKMHLINDSNKIINSIGLQWTWNRCRLENVITHPGALHHKSLFEKYGLFNTEFRICGDYEFLLRPGKYFKTAFMDTFTVRMATGGISANAKQLFKEHYSAVTTTGKLNKPVAVFFYFFQMFKHHIKTLKSKFLFI